MQLFRKRNNAVKADPHVTNTTSPQHCDVRQERAVGMQQLLSPGFYADCMTAVMRKTYGVNTRETISDACADTFASVDIIPE